MRLIGGRKHLGQAPWFFEAKPAPKRIQNGYRFSLKGSPRHYDDVVLLIERDPGAHVYFGEALTYERGAGVALWRIEASSFAWLTELYAWWAEQERLEPVQFTFHLYFPEELKYAAIDLRDHTPDEVAVLIQQKAPRSDLDAVKAARRN